MIIVYFLGFPLTLRQQTEKYKAPIKLKKKSYLLIANYYHIIMLGYHLKEKVSY